MDPALLNTLINTLGLILTAIIGAGGLVLSQRIAKVQSKTVEIEEVVKVIRVDVDGKLKQILELTERASRAEGRGEARDERRKEDINATAVLAAAALNAIQPAVVAAVPQIVASAEVVPTPSGETVKVIVEGERAE